MARPKRTLTREIRTRKPVHPGREADELDAVTWPESIRVRDVMTRGVATIHSDALARGAADMIRARKIRHLPVVDRDGRLVGIVTDRDLRQMIFDPAIRQRVSSLADRLKSVTVAEVMTTGVLTVRPGMDIRDAASLMHEQKIGALPVVDGDRLVGVLTESDVLKVFAKVLEQGGLSKSYRWAWSFR